MCRWGLGYESGGQGCLHAGIPLDVQVELGVWLGGGGAHCTLLLWHAPAD